MNWEYRKIGCDAGQDVDELNDVGREGWELVSSHQRTDSDGEYWYVFILKRPVPLNPAEVYGGATASAR